MKFKTIIATTLLLLATTVLATDTKKEQDDKPKLDDWDFVKFALIETKPDSPRDPETGLPENPDLVNGECHVMPDGYCLFW